MLDYFNTPNVDNCYWAGFIAADGCLVQGKKINDKSVKICISNKDKDLLLAFKRDVRYDGEIKTKEYSTLTIFGVREWHENLKKYWNITTNKTLTLVPPNLNSNSILSRAFIRGYIDGHGGISNVKQRQSFILRFNVCGTLPMVKWIRSNIGIDNKIILNGVSKVNYTYRISGQTAKRAFKTIFGYSSTLYYE